MINHLHALAVFAKVAEAGSFRAAADQLGVSASVASHHVTSLERHLDTPLIYRSTRKLSLTAAGNRLLGSAQSMLQAAEQGFADIGFQHPNLTGSLKITAPAVLQYARFVTRVATFMKHYPNVEMSIGFSDQRQNIIADGYDLGFRVGQLEDSALMSRKLADGRLIVCASPDYLRQSPDIKRPKDLQHLELIDIIGLPRKINLSRTKSPAQEHLVPISSRISVNSGFTARRLAEEGCGVTILPDFLVEQAIEDGRLVRLLADWQAPPFGIFAIWPANSASHQLRSLFLNFIAGISRSNPDADTKLMPKPNPATD